MAHDPELRAFPTDQIHEEVDTRPMLFPEHESRSEPQLSNDARSNPVISEISQDKLLTFGAKQIFSLFVPVSASMLLVALIAQAVKYYSHTKFYLLYTPFHSDRASGLTIAWQSVANALIFISLIIFVTIILVVLFKYRCYKIIYTWLTVITVMILFIIGFNFFFQIFVTMEVFVDWISIVLLMWNFGIVGILVIYWSGPLIIQQCYLVFMGAQLALLFVKYLPPWTCWVFLGVLSVWDLIAVLCPMGPLRLLVEMAIERNETMLKGIIYSTAANFVAMVSANMTDSDTDPNQPEVSQAEQALSERDKGRNVRTIQQELERREDTGVKLGLGDFVFYSVLMGRAALDGDAITVAACYIAILIGMCVTIVLLAIFGKALPALPVSIAFGIAFYFATSNIISPFCDMLILKRVFI